MILVRKDLDIIFLPIDLLGIAAVTYLTSGILYGFFGVGYVYSEAVYSIIGCLSGWSLFRPRAIRHSHIFESNISVGTEIRLLVFICIAQLVMLAYFLYGGVDYLTSGKVERYEQGSTLLFLRIPFYASLICLILLVCEGGQRFSGIKNLLIFFAIGISIIEMNRELLIIVALLCAIRLYKNNNRLVIPQGFFGFIVIIFAAIFFLVFLKPLLYLIVLGRQYDGGLINFGEAVNWYRWLDYAATRSVDLSQVQRNDLNYSLASIVLPYSPFESASKLWFRDVLGNDHVGMTYGYSGVLWLSHYFKSWTIMLPWMLLFYLYSFNFKVQGGVGMILQVGLAIVSYRFFRSEWPLVLKTYLWLFVYPSVILFMCSRLRLSGNNIIVGTDE